MRRAAVACNAVMIMFAGLAWTASATAATEDLGNGYLHHGVATPVSNHRGIVATVDGDGRNVVLAWLFDHRGGYALLLIDAQTGKSEEIPMPFPPGGDTPFASILSSDNKFYTHFNSHFCEFDPAKRAFTFHHKTVPQMAMGMTEDDNGVIWSVTYPQSGVASFDPKTREFKDYGHVYKQNWAQYQRHVAADEAGWIYFGIGSTASQIVTLDPTTGKAKPLIAEDQRQQGAAGQVFRDVNGKVYGTAGDKSGWYEFYKGKANKLPGKPKINAKPIITSNQGLFHQDFPDGSRVLECDLVERSMTVKDAGTNQTRTLKFDYTSEGAHVLGVQLAPDGTICGGTAFPMRFFSYDPATDTWVNRASYGQWNTITTQGDRFFAGGYGNGFLLEWDPSRDWVPTKPDSTTSNPQFLAKSHPDINRPHDLLATEDGSTVILAGTPGYGYTGGGLLIWDRKTSSPTLLKHTDLIPQQSTMSMVVLPDGTLLAGTTTAAGTGGEKKANLAELYLLDLAGKKLEWHEAVLPGVQTYTDLCLAPSGLVYGVADYSRFFVFDPKQRKVVHERKTADEFGRTTSQQSPRVFVHGPDGSIYMLFNKGVARVDPENFNITLLAPSPVPINAGGTWHEGRIYFASGSHVYSYVLSPGSKAE